MSTTAIAFASCRVTYALPPATVMYSGSRLREIGRSSCGVGPNTRTSSCSVFEPPSSKSWKSAVCTSDSFGAATSAGRSTTATDPSGSVPKSSDGSPSLATSACAPSGVSATMSGSDPTGTVPSTVAEVVVASKNISDPGAVLSSFSSAMTPSPSSRTAMEFATPEPATVPVFSGLCGSEMSMMSTVAASALTVNAASP